MKSSFAAIIAVLLGAANAFTEVTLSSQTWYGWPDNCDDGYTQGCGNNDVAYDCLGRGYYAEGDGSHDNPLTYATASGSSLHVVCEITWFPFLKKYLVMADTCTGCGDDQIDVWIGDGDGGSAETDCENNSPSGNGHVLIRDGSSSHTANTNALWSSSNGCQVSENSYPDGE